MKILNRNTFSEEEVTSKKMNIAHPSHEEITLIYIGKNCYSLEDLEGVIEQIKNKKKKDFNDVLNYRVSTYTK
jgi:predicted aconitase